MSDPATRVRDLLRDELVMCGHELLDLGVAALDVDGSQVVVVGDRDGGGVRIVYEGGEYSSQPAAINWPLLVSALSAVATQRRARAGRKK